MRLLLRLLTGRSDSRPAAPGSPLDSSASKLHADSSAEATERAIEAASRCCEERRHTEALAILSDAIVRVGPNDRVTYTKARVLHASGRYRESRQLLSRLRHSGFQHDGLIRYLGWAHLAMGDLDESEACMREAVAREPDNWESHYGLAEALRARDPNAAKAVFMRALSKSPKNIHCLLNLCACNVATSDAKAAETIARHAIGVAPDSVAAWNNLGGALLMQDRVAEAKEAFATAEDLPSVTADDDTRDLNRGIVLRLMGMTHEAIKYYQAHLPECPSVVAHGQYALALLTAGKFAEGWDQYEFRWLDPFLASQRARYDRPVWNGQDLHGKVILLRCEQGVGDVFQFIRYAPRVKACGATVYLELRPGLGRLADGLPGVDRTFPHGEVIPDFDYYIDLLSLPRAFRTVLETIPARVPYISAPAHLLTAWRDRLNGPELKVGLVWAGDPRHARDRERSVALDAFDRLIEIDGTRWFSLQKGNAVEALCAKGEPTAIADLDPYLSEYADTAAAIENLDLVVTVDTSVAHLAGALGKPVWVLLPFCADWRWLENRDDTPWYPTMRLFRQRVAHDWQEAIDRLRTAILGLLRSRSDGRTVTAPVSGAPVLMQIPGEQSTFEPLVSTGRISRACRTRVGMLQYLPEAAPLSASIAYYGEYLQAHVEILRRLIRPGSTIAEINAGIGAHTFALASMVGSQGHVLAFERSHIVRRILNQNVVANDVKSVSVMPSGATNATLDELQLESLDVVKINDAASAVQVLNGAENTLWCHRPLLLAEQSSYEALNEQAVRLFDFGYRCWCIETPLFNTANFNRREHDLFPGMTTFALLAVPEERDMSVAPHPAANITPLRA